ncbi:sigma-54-dependent Fis family transcriptional regulator [Geotalea uraniireducens]|uniref:GAF modulated sigma-54 specific transcriptional regulator, Fis family n=1 Tax=Geotalea uraniireducens (strain Rf4) TaxID=351605 RepID=A5G9N8_GEOUR|nr:sigma-54 dependent transcriptional regulator [Geotalea uraniireducens]ABQ28506.1 GAF modulated sigma-54 specific transcriptional regulator, Fis family [Geotalea uraniireducens Rf4]
MALVNPYVTYPKDRRNIHKLRDRFEVGRFANEQLNVYEKKLITDWSRCKTIGVDPGMRDGIVIPEDEFRIAVAHSSFIIEKAEPILQKVSNLLVGVPGILILTDNQGTILHIVGDSSVRMRAADESSLIEGSRWLESLAGTNGIGTAIAQKEAVHVFSNEHFCEGWHQWSCAATPILDPFTEEVLGVVDFTTFDKDYREDAVGLTYSLSGHIKAELRLQLELERMQLIHSYSDHSSRYPADGIVVLDRMGRVVRSSPGIDPDECDLFQRCRCEKEQPKMVQQVYLPGTEREIGSLLVIHRKKPVTISVPIESALIRCVATFGEFVTASENLKLIMERISKVIPSDINVLLIGETGTGKEIVANYIHAHSKRHAGPFVAVNCGAISKELFESKFFGYERGAFTGADPRGRKGVFECADGGTLFLDEVGEMPLEIQAALLRVLETGRFNRVGSEKEIATNCRIVAATNRSLSHEITRGTFRADLYYRLGVATFDIPPLRERPEDIPVLIQRTMVSLCRKHDLPPSNISEEAMELLTGYSWPGNGREVRNVIESAMICGGSSISVQDLPMNIKYSQKLPQEAISVSGAHLTAAQGRSPDSTGYRINANISQREVHLIITTLEKYKDIALACEALGVSRATFYRKCKAHGITPSDYI